VTEAKGFLVLESGEVFSGRWYGEKTSGIDRAGEVVFNTGHSGYEEMATDPSYFSQILVMTAPQQGNYGEDDVVWESDRIWIEGFVCLEMQNSKRENSWVTKLSRAGVPVLTELDTRKLVLKLREQGTTWGAIVQTDDETKARETAKKLIEEKKQAPQDWVHAVSGMSAREIDGLRPDGPRIALLDYGCKKNTIRELRARSSKLKIFPSRTTAADVKAFNPHGIMLSNGPGDPALVEKAVDTLKELIGWRFIFGICMGHQILAQALGAKTYKLKFGHRGGNHPIKDLVLNQIYMTSQNHGYAVDEKSLPEGVKVSHINLNDNTVSGIYDPNRKVLSVQFHPESRPGPHDSTALFDYFVRHLT
jgi:carbamoyl-phosphate synthase small subunit